MGVLRRLKTGKRLLRTVRRKADEITGAYLETLKLARKKRERENRIGVNREKFIEIRTVFYRVVSKHLSSDVTRPL